MKLKLARPTDIPDDKLDELKGYLADRWLRAKQGRTEQVDDKYTRWSKAYDGVPLEETRTVPFYKSSNFVVKLIRMYLDTFVARSLNIIFATKPLCVVDGLPRELKEAWELYLNNKTLYQWDFYKLTRELCFRGNKNGTVATKASWVESEQIYVSVNDEGRAEEKKFTSESLPRSECVPFEDFYVYPITCSCVEAAEIQFHRVRYSEEEARRMVAKGVWNIPEDQTIEGLLRPPRDAKQLSQQADSGVVDPQYKEVVVVECHLRYSFTDDASDTRSIVVVFHPEIPAILDLYYNPYLRNLNTFAAYRPLPKEDLFYGESMCELLGQSQEEASVIHNDRRNNSFISNAVCFKRRNGSLIPNPSTNWYPGKVFDLDDLDDLDVFQVGRNYDDMLSQEDYVFQLAGKLSGIDDVMQGQTSGMMGKRGVYNTMGTLALLSEGNQRQDTNMRDVRETLNGILSISSNLQAQFGSDDPFIQTLPKEVQKQVMAVFQLLKQSSGQYMRHEIKSSSAGSNKEVERQNLLQIAQIMGQYGQTVQQMSMQLANPQLNPSLRLVMNDVVSMQKWLAVRLLRQFDEFDAEDVLPDLNMAIEKTVPGGGMTTETLKAQAQQMTQLPELPQGPTPVQPPQGDPRGQII